MKWEIDFWRWSSMPICIVRKWSSLGRLLTVQGMCRNLLNPGEQGTTRVGHRLPWCCHHWGFHIGCAPAVGVACQERHNLRLDCLDTRTKHRHATRDDIGCYTLGNLQAMLLNPVCNAWSHHLHREPYNTVSRLWHVVRRWEAAVPGRVPRAAPIGMFAATHPVASQEYCSTWSELAGEPPFWCNAMRASGGPLKLDCQLSYIQLTLSCRRQNSRDVSCQTWRLLGVLPY